jgi:hypothetical protein
MNDQTSSQARDAIATVMNTDSAHWFHQRLASQAESQSTDLIDVACFLKRTCDVQGLDQELQHVEVLEKPVMITPLQFMMKHVWPSLAMNAIAKQLMHHRRVIMNAPQGLITPVQLLSKTLLPASSDQRSVTNGCNSNTRSAERDL